MNLLAQTIRDQTDGVRKEETEIFIKEDSFRLQQDLDSKGGDSI